MVLEELDDNEWDPETVSRAGAYQTEALLKWAKFYHPQFRRQMAESHLGQYSLSVIGGYQLQAGSSAQEFGAFMKTLEEAGRGTKTLWAHLVRTMYDKLVIAGNISSPGVVLYLIRQLW